MYLYVERRDGEVLMQRSMNGGGHPYFRLLWYTKDSAFVASMLLGPGESTTRFAPRADIDAFLIEEGVAVPELAAELGVPPADLFWVSRTELHGLAKRGATDYHDPESDRFVYQIALELPKILLLIFNAGCKC